MASQPPNANTEQSTSSLTPKILEPEFNALTHCLKDAVVKTGQIYGFYANSRKLGIDTHVPNPPRSMTAALGRSIEKYDQICDSIEAHLTRSINVLERDLRREKERIEAEEQRKQIEALMLPPPVPVHTSETVAETPTTQSSAEDSGTNPRNSPVSSIPGRRPSAISISSLHRPAFPLKLDLSSTSLRISEEEAAMFSQGLASPVTLAPKSARAIGPNEFPPELIAAFNNAPSSIDIPHPDMDLTLAADIQQKPDLSALGVGLGDSSDKPIELDLDAMDIEMPNMNDFGNPVEMNESTEDHEGDGLFSPLQDDGEGEGADNIQPQKEEGHSVPTYDMDSKVNQELFGDFSSSGEMGVAMETDTSMPPPHSTEMPSSEDLLAQFSATQGTSPSSNPMLQGGEAFDLNSIDLSSLASQFYAQEHDSEINFAMDVETFLNMDTASEQRPEGDTSQMQNYT